MYKSKLSDILSSSHRQIGVVSCKQIYKQGSVKCRHKAHMDAIKDYNNRNVSGSKVSFSFSYVYKSHGLACNVNSLDVLYQNTPSSDTEQLVELS